MDLPSAVQAAAPFEDIQRLLAADPAAALTVDEDDELPVHCAAGMGRTDAVRALLAAAPATAAATDIRLYTPLHLAAMCGAADTVLLLLEAAPATALAQDVLEGHAPACGGNPRGGASNAGAGGCSA
jgi:ankyrin repeat protein